MSNEKGVKGGRDKAVQSEEKGEEEINHNHYYYSCNSKYINDNE